MNTAPTLEPQALTFGQAVATIRTLSADSTAAAIAQGRLLLRIEATELYSERYPSMTAFLAGEPLGISAHEARKRMQVARLVDAESTIPADLCLSALKRLVPLASEHRAAFDQIVSLETLPGMTVIELEACISKLVGCRHVATTEVKAQRGIRLMQQILSAIDEVTGPTLEAFTALARQIIERTTIETPSADDRRHVATPHAYTHAQAPMESMVHGSMDSKNHESMESMRGVWACEDEQSVETPAGPVKIPVTGDAVLRALQSLGYGKAREQAKTMEQHGVDALSHAIACLRWEVLRGGAERGGKLEPIQNPGALLRRRLTTGWQPPEAFYAAIRPDRRHEGSVSVQVAVKPVEDPATEPSKVPLSPLLAQLVQALTAAAKPWAMTAKALIETGKATLTADNHLAVDGTHMLGAQLVRKWADQITALGVVRGVCFA